MIIIAIIAVIFGLLLFYMTHGAYKLKESILKDMPECPEQIYNLINIGIGLIGFVLIMCGIYILI